MSRLTSRNLIVALGVPASVIGGALGIRVAPDAHAVPAQGSATCPRPEAVGSTTATSTLPFANRGYLFASHGSAGARVSIVELATGTVTTLPAGISDPHEVGVSPDGRWGVAADFGDYKGDYKFDGHRLAVFDLRAKKLARVIELGPHLGPHHVVFHPSMPNRAFVTTQTTQQVVEVDVEAGRVLGATDTRAVGSHMMALTADGRVAFTANEPEGGFSRIDLVRRAFVAKHKVGPGPSEGIGVTPDGGEVWLGFENGDVRIADANTGALRGSVPGFRSALRLTLSPDGKLAVVSDAACKAAQVVDVGTRRVLGHVVGVNGGGNAARILPDNRTAVMALVNPGAIVIMDLVERRVVRRFDFGGWVDGAAWGPAP